MLLDAAWPQAQGTGFSLHSGWASLGFVTAPHDITPQWEGGCACVSMGIIGHPSQIGALGLTDRELQLLVFRNREQLQQLSLAA